MIFFLGEGTRRFTDLKRGIAGISQRMLTVTLRGLERDGIITRTMYPVMPPRVDYALTPMGRTLLHAAASLIGWVDAAPGGDRRRPGRLRRPPPVRRRGLPGFTGGAVIRLNRAPVDTA